MKSFKDIFKVDMDAMDAAMSAMSTLSEDDAPTNTTSGVASKDAMPFKVSKFAGCDCIEVDSDTYDRCKFGKKKYGRWSGYIEDEALRGFVKTKFEKAEKLVFTNAATGASVVFKR